MSSKKDKKLKGIIRFSLKESVSLHEILKMAHIRQFPKLGRGIFRCNSKQ